MKRDPVRRYFLDGLDINGYVYYAYMDQDDDLIIVRGEEENEKTIIVFTWDNQVYLKKDYDERKHFLGRIFTRTNNHHEQFNFLFSAAGYDTYAINVSLLRDRGHHSKYIDFEFHLTEYLITSGLYDQMVKYFAD